MKTETLFRKVLVSDRVPTVYGEYNTDMGLMEYSPCPGNGWLCYPNPEPKEYWFEEVELPSEEEIKEESTYIGVEFEMGVKYILGFINNKK